MDFSFMPGLIGGVVGWGIVEYFWGHSKREVLKITERTLEKALKDKEELTAKGRRYHFFMLSFLHDYGDLYKKDSFLFHDSTFCKHFKNFNNEIGSWDVSFDAETWSLLMDEQIFKNKVRDEMRKHLCEDDDDVTEKQVDKMVEKLK
jgi:hypothetical protein